MLFLVDANLPPALGHALVKAGHRALHVDAVGLRTAEDDTIWEYALQQQAIVVTKERIFQIVVCGRR